MARGNSNDAHYISSVDGREIVFGPSDVRLPMKQVVYQADLGRYEAAENALYKIVLDAQIDPDLDPQVWLFFQEKLAGVVRHLGDYDRALRLGTVVTRLKRSDYTHDPATTLCSIGELCETLRFQDRLQEAFCGLRQGLESFDIEPFDTMRSTRTIGVLARIYEDSGDYKLSELLARDVLSAATAHLPQGHQYVNTCKVYVSGALARNNNILAAKYCCQQALIDIGNAQGKHHPNTILAAETLGNCLRYEKDFKGACKRLEESVHDVKNQVSVQTPGTLKSESYLAAVYALQGFTGESESMLRYILREQRRLLAADHRDIAWTVKALEHLENVKIDAAQDKIAWTSMHTKACREASTFFADPRRLHKPISEKSLDQYWPDSPNDEKIGLLSPDKIEQLSMAVKTCTKPEKFGGVLRLAAACGYSDAVQILLDQHVPVDSKSVFYGTALQAACAARSYNLARDLIQRGADVNTTGGILGSPLRAAVFHGDEHLVGLLLDHGADPVAQDQKLTSILQIAIAFQCPNIALLLLEHSPQLAEVRDMTYGDPLQEACAKGLSDVVRALLTHGSEPANIGGLFESAIDAARENGHDDVVRELSQHIEAERHAEHIEADKSHRWTRDQPHVKPAVESEAVLEIQEGERSKTEMEGLNKQIAQPAESSTKAPELKPQRMQWSKPFQQMRAMIWHHSPRNNEK